VIVEGAFSNNTTFPHFIGLYAAAKRNLRLPADGHRHRPAVRRLLSNKSFKLKGRLKPRHVEAQIKPLLNFVIATMAGLSGGVCSFGLTKTLPQFAVCNISGGFDEDWAAVFESIAL